MFAVSPWRRKSWVGELMEQVGGGGGGGGQSASVMTKVGGTSCRELGMRVGLVLSCMVEVEMVRQWLNHLTRISLPFVVRWSLSALYKF